MLTISLALANNKECTQTGHIRQITLKFNSKVWFVVS